MKILFVSKNKHKIREVSAILSDLKIEICPVLYEINEIQTENVELLVRDKLLKAFSLTGRSVLVEHTGLYIESLNQFPGGLTQIFWDKLQADKFSSLFGNGKDTKVIAKTIIGYCDSQKIHFFEGSITGNIAPYPKGPKDFQWDCIFTPETKKETFAEMGEAKKNEISMRKIAFDKFKAFLQGSK